MNGTLYSIFCIPSVREVAKEMSFEEILQFYVQEGNSSFSSQIGYIIKLLKSAKEEYPESDEEEEDDNDEDLLEKDLDKDEPLQPKSGELSGESLLTTEYLGIMTNMTTIKRNSLTSHRQSLDEPLQRPVTPNSNGRTRQRSTERSPPTSLNNSRLCTPIDSRPGTADSLCPTLDEYIRADSKCGRLSQESLMDRTFEAGTVNACSKEASSEKYTSPEYFCGFAKRPKIPRTPDDLVNLIPNVSQNDPKQSSKEPLPDTRSNTTPTSPH